MFILALVFLLRLPSTVLFLSLSLYLSICLCLYVKLKAISLPAKLQRSVRL
jgi:hypothetical protein